LPVDGQYMLCGCRDPSLTLLALTVFEHLHGSKGSTTGKSLMAKAGVVASVHGILVLVVLVVLVVC